MSAASRCGPGATASRCFQGLEMKKLKGFLTRLALQIGVIVLANHLAAVIVDRIGNFLFSEPMMADMIILASIYPIWKPRIPKEYAFAGWFLGSTFAIGICLFSIFMAHHLGPTGSFSVAVGFLGYGIAMGYVLSYCISYWVCRNKDLPPFPILAMALPIQQDERY